jgi:hypothetical protein
MKERTHSLPSFSTWLNKGFHLRAHAQQMSDDRTDPEISPISVFLALLHGFVFRLPSFQQLESDLHHSYLQHWIGAERAFRDDTLRYSLCGFDRDPLEAMLVDVNRRLKRGKAFDAGRVQGRRVAALDGIEVLSSFRRHGESCLERRVTRKDQAGRKIEEIQYYHRAVGCQMVHRPVKPLLAIAWLQPGEGEDTAALRLLSRLPERYGSRFFDILLLDALYAQTPMLELLGKVGWDAVISLKQNSRDLYQSAVRLFWPTAARFHVHREARAQDVPRAVVGYRRPAIYRRPSRTGAGGAFGRSAGAQPLSSGRIDFPLYGS